MPKRSLFTSKSLLISRKRYDLHSHGSLILLSFAIHHHNLYFNTIKMKAKKLVESCITYRHIDILNKNFRLE